MRILTVSNCPALEHLGSGYIVANFVRGLRALGHEVELLQPNDYEFCSVLRPRAMSYRQALGIFCAMRQTLARRCYDLVEFWGAEAWLATRWLKTRKANRPFVVQHSNGPEPRYNRMLQEVGVLKFNRLQSWHAETLLPQAFIYADAIVAVSDYDLGWLTENNLPRSGRRLAIEAALPDCFINRPLKPRATSVIGFCGTWLPRKGIELIAADIAEVLRRFASWRFVILGSNSSDDPRSRFPLDVQARVEVAPMIKDKEALARRYEEMEIFVLPSWSESFGIALAEAMACGCAAVTTPVGLGSSLVDGKEALILPTPQSPRLYRAVERLIIDADLRRGLAAAARERVQRLRWTPSVATLAQSYEQWIHDHRRAMEARGATSSRSSQFEAAVGRNA